MWVCMLRSAGAPQSSQEASQSGSQTAMAPVAMGPAGHVVCGVPMSRMPHARPSTPVSPVRVAELSGGANRGECGYGSSRTCSTTGTLYFCSNIQGTRPSRAPAMLAAPCRGQNCIRANSPSLGAAPLAFLLHFAHCCATPCRCFFFRSVRKPRMCSTATLASGCVSSRAA